MTDENVQTSSDSFSLLILKDMYCIHLSLILFRKITRATVYDLYGFILSVLLVCFRMLMCKIRNYAAVKTWNTCNDFDISMKNSCWLWYLTFSWLDKTSTQTNYFSCLHFRNAVSQNSSAFCPFSGDAKSSCISFVGQIFYSILIRHCFLWLACHVWCNVVGEAKFMSCRSHSSERTAKLVSFFRCNFFFFCSSCFNHSQVM